MSHTVNIQVKRPEEQVLERILHLYLHSMSFDEVIPGLENETVGRVLTSLHFAQGDSNSASLC